LAAWEAVDVDLLGEEATKRSFAMAATRGGNALLPSADDASGLLDELVSQAGW